MKACGLGYEYGHKCKWFKYVDNVSGSFGCKHKQGFERNNRFNDISAAVFFFSECANFERKRHTEKQLRALAELIRKS